MDGVSIRVDGVEVASDALARAIRLLSEPTDMWAAIGQAMVDSTRRRFDDGAGPGGVPWKPSFRATSGQGKTLIGEGNIRGGLMGSITYQADAGGVRWGSNLPYARIHQFGGTIRPKNKSVLRFMVGDRVIFADSVLIPARPFLGVDDEDFVTISGVALDKLHAAFGGGDEGA